MPGHLDTGLTPGGGTFLVNDLTIDSAFTGGNKSFTPGYTL